MTEIGGGRLPSAAEWARLVEEIRKRAISGAKSYDFQTYAGRFDARLQPLNWFTHSHGSFEICFVHDDLLRTTKADESENRQVWCALCLMWIDSAILHFKDRDVALAVESSLRAADALACSRPQKTPQEIRREMNSNAGKARAAKHPTAPLKAGAYQFWFANRDIIKIKAEMARQIHTQFPDLLNTNVILRWIREWEKQTAGRA